MRFHIQIETHRGWRYLRRGYWDTASVFTELAAVPLMHNTTESLHEAAMWTRRGVITSSGPCSHDFVKEGVSRNFPARSVAAAK